MRKAMFMLAAVLCPGLHAADETAAPTVKTYDVYGSTANEIADDLNEKSPLVEHGRHLHGVTEWRVQTSYRWWTDGHQCTLTSFDATLKVEMTLPHWNSPRHPSPTLRQQWERYSAALRKHEDGHAEVGEDARRQILARANALGPMPDCHVLVQKINDLVTEVIDAHRQMDIDYDAKTDHGLLQGAHFP